MEHAKCTLTGCECAGFPGVGREIGNGKGGETGNKGREEGVQ